MNKTKFKFLRALLLLCALIGLTIQSCKKEKTVDISDGIEAGAKDRLSMSKKTFDNLYSEMRKANRKVLPSNIKNSFPEFISLFHHESTLISKTSLSIKATSPLMMARKASLQASLKPAPKSNVNQNQGAWEEVAPTYDEVMTEIVDDQVFQSMLNVEGEIQVDNIIYKVTPLWNLFYKCK
ncbi:hypothetical protein [Pedobacter sp. N23S346]|uniref:hypothetical protein n=1 Tax=Pedobacter sp. N23S346 TaxID=3402750 RepID=UPI003AC06178